MIQGCCRGLSKCAKIYSICQHPIGNIRILPAATGGMGFGICHCLKGATSIQKKKAVKIRFILFFYIKVHVGYKSPSAEVLGMEQPNVFIIPTAFLSQENELSLRVGQCYTVVTHSMVSQIMPGDFFQSLRLVGFRLVALAVKNHHSRFLFLLLPLLFALLPCPCLSVTLPKLSQIPLCL